MRVPAMILLHTAPGCMARPGGYRTMAGRWTTIDDSTGKPRSTVKIIRGLKTDGDERSGGTILDPGNGKVYDHELGMEEGKPKVRGHIASFRTQTWVRAAP